MIHAFSAREENSCRARICFPEVNRNFAFDSAEIRIWSLIKKGEKSLQLIGVLACCTGVGVFFCTLLSQCGVLSSWSELSDFSPWSTYHTQSKIQIDMYYLSQNLSISQAFHHYILHLIFPST